MDVPIYSIKRFIDGTEILYKQLPLKALSKLEFQEYFYFFFLGG
jgi:hypothetical protein